MSASSLRSPCRHALPALANFRAASSAPRPLPHGPAAFAFTSPCLAGSGPLPPLRSVHPGGDCGTDPPPCSTSSSAPLPPAGQSDLGVIVPRTDRPSWCVSSPAPSSSGEHFVASSHSVAVPFHLIPPTAHRTISGRLLARAVVCVHLISRPRPSLGGMLDRHGFAPLPSSHPSRFRHNSGPPGSSFRHGFGPPSGSRSRSLRDRIRGPAVSPTVTVFAAEAEHLSSTCHSGCVPRRRSFPPWR